MQKKSIITNLFSFFFLHTDIRGRISRRDGLLRFVSEIGHGAWPAELVGQVYPGGELRRLSDSRSSDSENIISGIEGMHKLLLVTYIPVWGETSSKKELFAAEHRDAGAVRDAGRAQLRGRDARALPRRPGALLARHAVPAS